MKILNKTARTFYGIGIAGIGVQQFIYLEFRPLIFPASPAWIYASPIAACLVGGALIAAGALIIMDKRGKEASLLLGGFLFLLILIFQCSYVLFTQPNLAYHLGLWSAPLAEIGFTSGAFVMAGLFKNESTHHKNYFRPILEKFISLGKIFFSLTIILFGIDHFFYIEFIAALVPSWMPDHTFWIYFAGVAPISSGVAIILEIKARQVAMLLSTMFFLWVIILHIPRAIANPYANKGGEITSMFEVLIFSGTALAIACMNMNNYKETNIILFEPELQHEEITQY